MLAVLQLVVYAAMQIPVGIFLDRFGPKRILIFGGLTMALGQLILAFADNFEIAIVGRMLVGLGDACTFISMIRMVNGYLSGAKASKVQQWLATLGQLGQVASAFPFVWVLDHSGWMPAFASVAALSILGASLVWIFGGYNDAAAASVVSVNAVLAGLKINARRPPIRMAFWTHFTTQSSGTMFALLWGIPFLTLGQGYTREAASLLLAIFVITNASMGPIIGALAAKSFALRSRLVISAPILGLVVWVITLSWSGQAPFWLLVLLVIAIGVGGPASMLAFDYTRAYTPKSQLGSVNGLVNIGGFLASFVMMTVIGIALDFINHGRSAQSLFSLDNFKLAIPIHFLVTGIGLFFYVRELRATLATEGLRE